MADILKSLTNKLKVNPQKKKEYEALGNKTQIGLVKGEQPIINLSFSDREISFGETVLRTDPEVATTRDILGSEWDRYHTIVNYYVNTKEMLENCLNILTAHKLFNEIPEEFDDLARHFRRMKNTYDRGGREYTNDDFYQLGVKNSTSYCEIKNLEAPFDILNSDRYLDNTKRYKIKSIGSKQTIIETNRHPYAESKEDLESKQASMYFDEEDNLIKNDSDSYDIKINNEYVGVVRRFAIVISTKSPPVNHYGMYAIATSSGNKLYVYACDFDAINYKDDKIEKKLGVWGASLVVLGYGFTNVDLEKRLVEAKNWFISHCDGRCAILIKPTEKFEEGVEWNDSETNAVKGVEFD